MEDLNPDEPTPNSPLPEAGNDPGDPLAPEIEEENEPDTTIGDPSQDVDATGENEIDKDDDLSDNESLLSDVDEAQFQDFDPAAISLEDREQIAIDDDNVKLLGVHKRKRTEAEIEESRKRKKERKREKSGKKAKRKRDGSEPFSGGEELDGKRRQRKAGGEEGVTRRRAEVDESTLAPEERRKRELDRKMDEALKAGNRARVRKDGIDLEQAADEEVAVMAKRMTEAAMADAEARKRGEPAMAKLQLLPEVSSLLNRGGAIQQSIVDPDNDLLRAIRFFLEPAAGDAALPAYAIQKELFAVLPKLPIGPEELRGDSRLGQCVLFYTKSKKPEPAIKRQAERLLTRWMGLMLKRSDDYRQRDLTASQSNALPMRTGRLTAEELARESALETPIAGMANRARVRGGVGTYTIAPPKQYASAAEAGRAPGASSDARFRKMQMRAQGRAGR